MTSLNIVAKSTIEEQIAQIEKDCDLKIALITEKYDIIDKKFESIYGYTWRKTLQFIKENRIEKENENAKKALEINQQIRMKISMIKEEAQKKINMIEQEEKNRKIADLDNLINEICK